MNTDKKWKPYFFWGGMLIAMSPALVPVALAVADIWNRNRMHIVIGAVSIGVFLLGTWVMSKGQPS